MDSIKENQKKLIDSFIPYKELENIPEWQKQLWIELLSRSAKETWPYEKIINEYGALRESYYDLLDKYEKIKGSGEKNIKLNENIDILQNKISELKIENESLKNENIEKNLNFEKIKEENQKLLKQILKDKDTETELQNKILELESQIYN